MALKPTTNLEDHPVNTAGLNGIINANWDRLEAIFLPLAAGGTDIQIGWDAASKTFTVRAASEALAYAASVPVSFTGAKQQTIALTGDLTITTSNLAAGRTTRVVIAADASLRNLTFPAGWTFVGSAAPASIAANKTALLELESTTAADAGVLARWTVEP